MKKYYIYALICPIFNEVKYIGATINPKNRFMDHISRKKSNNKNKDQWINWLKSNGHRPIIKILFCELTKDEASKKEVELIKFYPNLLNVLDGGIGMPPSNKGNRLTIEQKIEKFKKSPLKKVVLQIDKYGKIIAEHEGVREAHRITGIDHRSISQVASGSLIRKTAGGYIWKYKQPIKNG